MGEVAHDHIWWHYFLCWDEYDDDDGFYKVFDDPFSLIPEHFADGYECVCGASPEGGAP